MLVKLSVLLLLTKVWRTNSSGGGGGGGGIRVKQTSDGAGNLKFKLSMKVKMEIKVNVVTPLQSLRTKNLARRSRKNPMTFL